MSKILELEKQLAEAKEAEKLASLQKELEQVKAEYEGKCFGSHTFTRRSAAVLMGAVHYEKFYIKDSKIWVLERSFHLGRHDNVYKSSKTDISFARNYYERCVFGEENNNYHASYNTFSGYSFYRKEISLEKFEQLWNGVNECEQIVKSVVETNAPELKIEAVAQGDFNNEDRIDVAIKELNLDAIDFKDFPKVHHHIEYATLPMFQDRRWMPRIYAKQILQYHVKKLVERQQDSWTSSRMHNALQFEIDVINNFINTELCQNKK